MATFKFFDGNLGFYGYNELAAYAVVQRTATSTTLDWRTSLGALDPEHYAAHVTLTYTGYSSYVVEEGVNAGQTRVTGGTLTGISYTDAAGKSLLEVTNLNLSLSTFMATLARSDSFGTWAMITRAGGTINGSASAAGTNHDGTGDSIESTMGNDTVFAWAGDDFVRDRGGADSYSGGGGFDTLSYDGWSATPWLATSGITVNQALGEVRGPDGRIDKVSGFEAILGSFMDDTMRGNFLNNKFEGGAGADYFDGRGGRDTVSYADDAGWGGTDGVRVNLAANRVRDGFGFIDKIYSIETVIGTAQRDVFFDNRADNYLDGGAGNDLIHCGGGNDTAHGGSGADIFYFDGNFGDDFIDDFLLEDADKFCISGASDFSQLVLEDVFNEDGDALVITFNGNSVTVLNNSTSIIHAEDFIFL